MNCNREHCTVWLRLDQTLGKPGATWMISNSKERQRMTVVARLARVEMQVHCIVSVLLCVVRVLDRMRQS